MAVDYFLKIDGIPGESQQVNHKLEFEMLNWSFGETMKATPAAGTQGGVEKVNLGDFHFTKRFDKASSQVFQQSANVAHIKWARFTARRAGETGGQPVDYLFVTFGQVVITNYEVHGRGEDGWPSENISFSYKTIVMTYRQMINGVAQGPVVGGYDASQNILASQVAGAPALPAL
jgi:type VI secretion system secreted protein Hcp